MPSPPDGLTLLVADDDADMRLYLAGCLRRFGRVLEAPDGGVALHLARTEGVGLVVTDLEMPVMDGAALCRALRDDPATAGVPLLLLTGDLPATRSADRARGTGCADGVLQKPFNAASLHAEVERVLALPA